MLFFEVIARWIEKKASIITKIKHSLHNPDQALYRIEEINTKLNEVVLHSYGMRVTLRSPIVEIIADHNIINNLSAPHACWLGYYYGKQQRAETNITTTKHQMKHVGVNLRDNKGHYKIISQERNGEIKYINIQSRKEFKKSPLFIAQNETLISQFDPSQACHIGMLAGLAANKHNRSLSIPERHTPMLKIVK
jgi:hypothetical protein